MNQMNHLLPHFEQSVLIRLYLKHIFTTTTKTLIYEFRK